MIPDHHENQSFYQNQILFELFSDILFNAYKCQNRVLLLAVKFIQTRGKTLFSLLCIFIFRLALECDKKDMFYGNMSFKFFPCVSIIHVKLGKV